MYVSVEWRIIMDDICIIGIAGGTASGKTTIVNKLKDFLEMMWSLSAMTATTKHMTICHTKKEQSSIMTTHHHLIQI